MSLIGEGLSILDLTKLLTAIREKDLVIQVKILDGGWEDVSRATLHAMLRAVTSGAVTNSNDIRMRLFGKVK